MLWVRLLNRSVASRAGRGKLTSTSFLFYESIPSDGHWQFEGAFDGSPAVSDVHKLNETIDTNPGNKEARIWPVT